MRQVRIDPTFASWQRAAKWLLLDQTPPKHIEWVQRGTEQASLFASAEEFAGDHPGLLSVPREFIELARAVACHRDPRHWGLMYRVLWRLLTEDRQLLKITVDPDIRAMIESQQQVRRDAHHMLSFVRFRELKSESRFVAWYRPDHRITRRIAPSFVKRFRAMHWSILTPDECAHWDGDELQFSPGVQRQTAPAADAAIEDLWREYYRSTFNPARVNEALMRQLMPARHWENMPEAEIIHETIANSAQRVAQMLEPQTSTPKIVRR